MVAQTIGPQKKIETKHVLFKPSQWHRSLDGTSTNIYFKTKSGPLVCGMLRDAYFLHGVAVESDKMSCLCTSRRSTTIINSGETPHGGRSVQYPEETVSVRGSVYNNNITSSRVAQKRERESIIQSKIA